jgi:hypothetical protein
MNGSRGAIRWALKLTETLDTSAFLPLEDDALNANGTHA